MEHTDLDILHKRAEMIRLVREFFRERDYLEVDTALLCPALIPESSLEVFQTLYRPRRGSARQLFLIPSPELWMKRLICAGSGSIFQICKSFRNSEPATDLHNPEFTMLEWYTVAADYTCSMDTTEELIADLISKMSLDPLLRLGERRLDCTRPFLRLSMAEAFRRSLDLDLRQLTDHRSLSEAAAKLGLSVAVDDRREDLFHKIFLAAVEPGLPRSRALFLYDYPALVPTLARRKAGTPWAERWELYLGGVEVANCYSEENDPVIYEQYYADQEKEKTTASVVHPSDRELVRVIREQGLPECSGVALGLERLLLFFLGQSSIRRILPYGAFFPTETGSPD